MYLWLLKNRERVAALVAASVWAKPLAALAVVSAGEVNATKINDGAFKDVGSAIRAIFSIVITVAGVAFVVLFLLGGIQYLGGAGNDESTKKARQLMLDAVIGLAIVVVAWAVGTYVLQLLGLSTKAQLNLDPDEVGA